MHFAHTYKKTFDDLLNQGTKMHKFFNTIKTNKVFRRWLEYILAFGNYMNGIGFYGGAHGFKMGAIKQILEVKSTDDKKTLMEYLIEVIGRNEKDKEILDFFIELKEIQEGN